MYLFLNWGAILGEYYAFDSAYFILPDYKLQNKAAPQFGHNPSRTGSIVFAQNII